MNNALNLIADARRAGRHSLSESDGKRLLAAFGVKAPRSSTPPSAATII